MSWGKVGESVISVAPALGAALGGPLGGAAGVLIAEVFGVDATPEKVSEAIKNDPNSILKLAEIERDKFASSNLTVQQMLISEANATQTTRPYIAKQAFHVLAFAVICVTSIFCYAVWQGDAKMLKALISGEWFILTMVAPLVTILLAYFGVVRSENQNKVNAATGNKTAFQSIVEKITKGS